MSWKWINRSSHSFSKFLESNNWIAYLILTIFYFLQKFREKEYVAKRIFYFFSDSFVETWSTFNSPYFFLFYLQNYVKSNITLKIQIFAKFSWKLLLFNRKFVKPKIRSISKHFIIQILGCRDPRYKHENPSNK